MPKKEFHIFGSCVSRDTLDFSNEISVGKYCARQSIISSVSKPPSQKIIENLSFIENTHEFYKRIVKEDFEKTSLDNLQLHYPSGPIIIDLIEERAALGVTDCEAYITYSQAASSFTNVQKLISKKIKAYSDEHFDLFLKSAPIFSKKLSNREFIIHKALYAEGDWDFENQNKILEEYYKILENSLNKSVVIEIKNHRISSPRHKWGFAPYHYIDNYYIEFVKKLNDLLGDISIKSGFSLQKPP